MSETNYTMVVMCAFGLAALCTGVARGQDYPHKPIRIITTSPGGGSDFMSRVIAQGISSPLGQPVIVENRSSGFMPGQIASQALPDGYTLLFSGTSFYIETLLRSAPYDPIADFSPITIVATEPNILVVHPSVAAASVTELISLAKSKPGVFNYSSNGVGSSGHLAAELFKAMAGVNIVHIPFTSPTQAVADQLTGQVQIRFGSLGPVVPHVKAGKLRALALTSVKPSALFPGLPTVAATLPGYEFISGSFMFAPAKTPPAHIKRLNYEIVRFLKTPEAHERIFPSGQEITASPPQELAVYLKSEMAKMGKVIKDIGIKAN